MKYLLLISLCIIYYLTLVGANSYQEQLKNKDLAIKSLVDYYEDEDRKLLLQANEMMRLRGIK